MKITLSERMKCIADMLSPGKRVADIGCDHALVSIYLAKEKNFPKVLAMDIGAGPLEAAKANIDRYGLGNVIETRISDGMQALTEGETDAAIIAGMGGITIIGILENGLHKISEGYEFILSPQSEIPEVRTYLRTHGFCIIDEEMLIEDGKYYNVMKAIYQAEKTENDATDNDLDDTIKICDLFGEKLLEKKSPVLCQYIDERIEKMNTIYCKLSKQSGENVVDRMAEINVELKYLELVRNRYY